MSIYHFCNDCQYKVKTYNEKGKLIKFSCPARFNPWDEDKKDGKVTSRCPKHEQFMKLETQKNEERLHREGRA